MQAFATMLDNLDKCESGNTVDAYNQRISESGISPTLTTRPEGFKTAILVIEKGVTMNKAKCEMLGMLEGGVYDNMHDISRRVYSDEGVAPTLHTCGGGNLEPKVAEVSKDGKIVVDNETVRVRKLTEKECFRLMGVKDEDFEKIARNQSRSSLYHLAGDSIVTAVLMAIFAKMIKIQGE